MEFVLHTGAVSAGPDFAVGSDGNAAISLALDLTLVSEQISPRDMMYQVDPAGYFRWGRAGLACISRFLALAEKHDVQRILDFPSGHGRVLRYLRAAFPNAEVVACDVDRDAAEFCAWALGATPALSREDPELADVTGTFDLIWCGSLLTHFDPSTWERLLNLFGSLMRPYGLLVFTTHGPIFVDRLESGVEKVAGLPGIADLTAAYAADGFAFQSYPGQEAYGLSLSSPAWVCRFLERLPVLTLLAYHAGGWNGHQDAVACIATPR